MKESDALCIGGFFCLLMQHIVDQTSGCTNILYYTFLQLLVAFSFCALHLIITLFYFNLISIFFSISLCFITVRQNLAMNLHNSH